MAVSKVLIIGGGITGSMLAVGLAQGGVEVDLVEISPVWTGVGHGITVQGNALRSLQKIGVLDEVLAQGVPFDGMRLRNADGSLIVELTTPHTGGEELPSTMGSLRSSLQTILCRAVYDHGVTVKLGTTVESLTDDGQGVTAQLSDGTSARYDVVVGADGIRSKTRKMIGIDQVAEPVGMGIWRVVAPRPAEMDCAEVYYGGPRFKAGYSPISKDLCYAYILDENLDRSVVGEGGAELLRERSAGYGGTWGTIREGLTDDIVINYQWIEAILLADPWYRGRVIVVGDAAHACPPLIAQGAAQCTEDAVVLAELLQGDEPVENAFKTFMARRLPRVQLVIDTSMKLAQWEMNPGSADVDPGRLMNETLEVLREPA
jgi:2-polyprenyl-6-methoxyphenol hydroxylase-like FAD-dependent oxidoreductase